MPKTSSRNENDIHRSIRKDGIRRGNNDYMGMDGDEIEKRIGGIPCRFCGQYLRLHRDWGHDALWVCDSINCPNNIDSRPMFEITDVDTKMPNDESRIWSEWEPRRII